MQHRFASPVSLLFLFAAAWGGQSDTGVGTDGGTTPVDDGGIIIADATSPFDAGLPQPPDASVPPSDGGIIVLDGGGSGPITCGQTTCNSSTQVCCVTFSNQQVQDNCVGIGQCQNGITLACTSALSCPPGDVCCASFTQTSSSSQCELKCPTGFGNRQLCASTSECQPGLTCQPGFGGLMVCRP